MAPFHTSRFNQRRLTHRDPLWYSLLSRSFESYIAYSAGSVFEWLLLSYGARLAVDIPEDNVRASKKKNTNSQTLWSP